MSNSEINYIDNDFYFINIEKKTFYAKDKDIDQKLKKLKLLFIDWNQKINLISRKDIDQIETHHFAHSLLLLHHIPKETKTVLDIGTGGGLPGLLLAVFLPNIHFYLIDSINKKCKVVRSLALDMDLKNVTVINDRVENWKPKHSIDVFVSRSVAKTSLLIEWTQSLKKPKSKYIFLKGGDLTEELEGIKKYTLENIYEHLPMEHFKEKKILIF